MGIILESIHKWYNRNMANEVHALKDVNLTVEDNSIICIQGASGSGKSTLLSVIGCLFPPTSGRAVIDGKRLSRLPDRFLTIHRRETIGFVFQRFNVIPELSVLDNITLPLIPLGKSPAEQQKRADQLMDQLSISHRRKFPVSKISGGELQRTAIARALINDPPIIVADEPTAHLDTSLSLEFMSIMVDLQKAGKTIIIASHDPLVSSHQVVNSFYSMHDGELKRDTDRK